MARSPKLLTKTITPLGSDKISEKLWSRARQRVQPVDYFKGWPSGPVPLPERLLMFTRGYTQELQGSPAKAHHHRFVLTLVLEGTGTICVDEKIHPMSEGSSLLVFPFQFHHYLVEPKQKIRWLFITFEWEDSSFLEPLRNRPAVMTELSHEILGNLVASLPEAIHTSDQTIDARLWLALLLRNLLTRADGSSSKPVSIPVNDEAQLILERVNRYLCKNVTRTFKNQELARACGYSESHLRSLFRQHIHLSLGKYIAESRLHRASALLHQSLETITAVSDACGYSSVFAFSRAFRHHFGISPREYRNKLRRS